MLSRYEQFSTIISTIYRSIQKIERDEMVKYGYKGSYAQYLTAINRYPEGLTCNHLCEICDKDKAAISRAINEMEDRDLVVRRGSGDSMYRARLFLTEKGREVAEMVSRRANVAVEVGGQGLTDADRRIFYAALDKISANLHRVGEEGIPPKTEEIHT